jgi:transposase
VPFHRQHQAWRYGLDKKPKGFQLIPRRWVVERTFAWMARFCRLALRYERRADIHLALATLAAALICLKQIRQFC